MSDSKAAQAARHEVDRQLREENRPRYEELMTAAFAKRGLSWTPRRTAQERAAAKVEAKKQAVAARIKADAAKVGLGVVIVEDPDIEAKIEAVNNGTAEGVSFDWHGDANGFADEQVDLREALADTDDENYQSREAVTE